MPRTEAIIDAGRKRARPIVMTTIAMSAGMVPAALALGDGGEFRAPMAIAVIGGLLVSTVLSLVFVPSFYTIMDDAANGAARLFRWLVRPNEKDDPLDQATGAPGGRPASPACRPSPRRSASTRRCRCRWRRSETVLPAARLEKTWTPVQLARDAHSVTMPPQPATRNPDAG